MRYEITVKGTIKEAEDAIAALGGEAIDTMDSTFLPQHIETRVIVTTNVSIASRLARAASRLPAVGQRLHPGAILRWRA